MSDTLRPPKGPYLRKRKMIPWAWTADGHTPWKEDTGISMEADHGYPARRVRRIREVARAINRYNNGRARTYRKQELRRIVETELASPEGPGI